MKIKIFKLTLLFALLGCDTIASLQEEPRQPKENTLATLSAYEDKLANYVMYLQTWLVRTKQKVKDKKYPKFEFFDTTTLKYEHTLKALKENIAKYKAYILYIKPIATAVYNKYSKTL
ncbi:BBA14 family lipoprotein [Candidatus Borreliella tachyglossi]|uniref:BBA14 family lipoprotein n=1 Tax=Candidatus Borreliella tachyglossi TaxID=1964448 RepID=UPI004040F6DA